MNLKQALFQTVRKLTFAWHRIKTRCWYGLLFARIGVGTSLWNPIFLINPAFISLGSRVIILDGARMEALDGGSISIGDNTAIGQNFHITAGMEPLDIGANVLIVPGVLVTNIDHSYTQRDVHVLHQPNVIRTTSIGDYCFIGAGARILAGSRLGKHCIVAANAIVRGDFPDYCVIAGIPGKIVKRYNPASDRWEATDH